MEMFFVSHVTRNDMFSYVTNILRTLFIIAIP